jgi:branched-subunit amino acid aminotransferase/4-amino-4-deoxychorismate lyase
MNTAPTVWLNGRFLPVDEARISPLDRGFIYGDGFFETIGARGGKILWLPLHLERLEAALCEFRISVAPVLNWEAIARRLLEENGLSDRIAAIKIIVTRGISTRLGLPEQAAPTVLVTALSYDPPVRLYEQGCKLHVCREGFASPLAGFKALNYLYNLRARQIALDAGCDMAILLDPLGRVTETCTGSLLALTDNLWWTPESPLQLPGTALRTLASLMEKAGMAIHARAARPEDLCSADTVWVLNSMIGIVPVAQIDGKPVRKLGARQAAYWRQRLFQ